MPPFDERERLEDEVREEKSQIERRIAVVPHFAIDEHQSVGPNKQIFGTEVAMHQRPTMVPHRRDEPFHDRRERRMDARDLAIIRIEPQVVEELAIIEFRRHRRIEPRRRM